MTIWQKYMIFFHLFFLCALAFEQKLWSSLIFFFYLHTIIRKKYMIVFHLLFLCARPFDQKLGSSLLYFSYLYTTTILPKLARAHSYSLVYSFLFANISFAIFMAVLPLYFVCYIHSSTTYIFRTLKSWKSCAYISYAIFMAIWSRTQPENNAVKDGKRP